MIPVSSPFLPPIEDYTQLIEGIWKRKWLTNNGPLVNDLELKLKEYLKLDHLLYLNNGTIALQIAIKALDLKGEIITTPFSFVATTSSIVWEKCKPVFVDIDEHSLNINPDLIEAAITPETTGILATHVYGNPCDIDKIEQIANKHKLKVIYDAAHCFGTKYNGKSVFEFGDISTTSFHATKLYHTIEGGAVFSSNPDLIKKMALFRNFGFNGPEDFLSVGINGKSSEFHAAMGLNVLKYIDEIMLKRKEQCQNYSKWLGQSSLKTQKINSLAEYNYAYYPIIFENEEMLIKAKSNLEGHYIYPRRYFYPSLNTVQIYKSVETPVSEEVSKRVLCLPLYYDLTFEDIDMISRIIIRTLKY